MKLMKDFGYISAIVAPDTFTAQQIADAGNKEVPEEWQGRFQAAENAIEEMSDTQLSDIIDTEILEDRYYDECDPSDDVLETFMTGNSTIVEVIMTTVSDAKIAAEVIMAIRDGELNELIQV